MKIAEKIGFSYETKWVRLTTNSLMDFTDEDKVVLYGEKLFSVDEYNRLLEESPMIFNDIILGNEVKQIIVYEFQKSVELSQFFDIYNNPSYQAWIFELGYDQPSYLYKTKLDGPISN